MKKAGHDVFIITTCRKESEAGELDYHGHTAWWNYLKQAKKRLLEVLHYKTKSS